MTTTRTVARGSITLGRLLTRGVGTVCAALVVVTLLTPSYVAPEPGVSAEVVPLAYLTGTGDAQSVFVFQSILLAFYWTVGRAARTDRLGFVTGTALFGLLSSVGTYVFVPNPGPLGEWVPLIDELTRGTVRVPFAALLTAAAVAWNAGLLVDDDPRAVASDGGDSVSRDDEATRRRSVVARLAGGALVGACLVVGLGSLVSHSLLPTVTPHTATLFTAFGAVVYELVSTDSLYGTAALAVGAWITGLAALQYDSALQGVALPAAVLLTLAAGGLWLDGR